MGGACSRRRPHDEAAAAEAARTRLRSRAEGERETVHEPAVEPASASKTEEASQLAGAPGEEEAPEDSSRVLSKNGCRMCWQKTGAMICRRCNKVKYCCAECQKSHWAVHKRLCGKGDGELQALWTNLFVECCKAEGDFTRHRQFLQHVGGAFRYSKNGHQIFHMAVMLSAVMRQFSTDKVRRQYNALLQEAIQLEADVNFKCSTGDTAMHLACKDGSKEAQVVIDVLLQQPQLDLRIENAEGATAEALCKTSKLKTLLACAAEEHQDRRDAAEAARLQMLREKKEAHPRRERCRECWKPGTSICRRCNRVMYCSAECQKVNWKTHSMYCGKAEGSGLRDLFSDACADAVTQKDVGRVRAYLQHVPGDLRADHSMGWWVIHTCVAVGQGLSADLTEELQKDVEGMLQDCVDFGCDVNAQTREGDTALHMLVSREDCFGLFMARWLLANAPVDVLIQNNAELTAEQVCHDSEMRALIGEKVEAMDKLTQEYLETKRSVAEKVQKRKESRVQEAQAVVDTAAVVTEEEAKQFEIDMAEEKKIKRKSGR